MKEENETNTNETVDIDQSTEQPVTEKLEETSEASEQTTEKVAESTEETKGTSGKGNEPKSDGPGKIFEFADLFFHCNQCDTETKVGEGVQGIQFTVPAAERATVTFECSNCGNIMKLFFKVSSDEVIKAKRAELAAMRAQQEELKKQDGLNTENTEERPTEDTSDSIERDVEIDTEATGTATSVDGVGSTVEA